MARKRTDVTLLRSGSCLHPEFIVLRGGTWGSRAFPNLFALIRSEEHGIILYDTGYSPRFFNAARRFPYSIYPRVTPVSTSQEESAVAQLASLGIGANEVRWIIISHFHADHIAGLIDFPAARFIFIDRAFGAVKDRRGFGALLKGYLPDLLPKDFEGRSDPLRAAHASSLFPKEMFPGRTYDIFGDGSLVGVELPGHSEGQLGVFVPSLERADSGTFLVADAVWTLDAVDEDRPPHALTRLIMPERSTYLRTIAELRAVQDSLPGVSLVPSHCSRIAVAPHRCQALGCEQAPALDELPNAHMDRIGEEGQGAHEEPR